MAEQEMEKESNEGINKGIDEETRKARSADEEERVLTLKISLEGPSELVSWLRERRPRLRLRPPSPFPREFRKHMRAAQREQLMAVRSLLDSVIERMDPDESAPRRTRRIDVE